MLKFQTREGVQYYADLLELCEDAAGAGAARPADVVGHMSGVLQRLLEIHPLDEQTRALKPLIRAAQRATEEIPS